MSVNFSVNQYDDAFRPRRIRNWETPRRFQEMPRTSVGTTQITANDNGHIKPEYLRSKSAPWGNFIGTWDLPKRLPGNNIDVPTARSTEANERLRRDFERSKTRLNGASWGTYNNTFYKEATRSYAAPTKASSKHGAPVTVRNETPTSAAPRKLSPIERNTMSPTTGELAGGMHIVGNVGFEHSYQFDDNKIPLPQLSRPVYADGNDRERYTVAAL